MGLHWICGVVCFFGKGTGGWEGKASLGSRRNGEGTVLDVSVHVHGNGCASPDLPRYLSQSPIPSISQDSKRARQQDLVPRDHGQAQASTRRGTPIAKKSRRAWGVRGGGAGALHILKSWGRVSGVVATNVDGAIRSERERQRRRLAYKARRAEERGRDSRSWPQSLILQEAEEEEAEQSRAERKQEGQAGEVSDSIDPPARRRPPPRVRSRRRRRTRYDEC